ncbi:TetR/AcrR family transcriptional regulator [Corynebacterium pseudodiphtheriticum]|uniref:TetR/AcrR family transcriptional regulator n=1 Tax=Corynebacterium pseudodiphtheriticum TaxID=37637 RepID=UPI0025518E86|nr:TetR/AcrR family transcriptional regulator [Corynebacterium pseudodiphtheriticum]MDK8395564.1 TetR/AcrR family transcriptional regulator [Corynebacterium pseudodiphtheriticum]MDK8552025.1 TetR/AcrR family transcriptional regulator [Corynebacterium pseudodiphtheriticum]MDK8563190.1 TetR/AcrR family transcriptional regulator [Corynebacterium pseudodiphtheriticum]
MTGTVGRPRKNRPRRRGANAREEILDASAELFTTQGFAMTSTHQIAEAVGIRQASLYYHFPSKAEIFLNLLNSTIEPSLKLAQFLSTSDNPVELRIWALVAAESRILLSGRWNVGRLYQLPVANSPEFADYHRRKARLAEYFRQSASEIVGQDLRADLPFHLALSTIEMRPNDGIAPQPLQSDKLPEVAIMLADAALSVLGAPLPTNREQRTLDLLVPSEET